MSYQAKDDREDKELQSLRPHHRAMARAIACGITPTELANRFGFTVPGVTYIINSPLFRAEVRRIELASEEDVVDIREELKKLSQIAVEVISEELYNPSPSARRTETAFKVIDIQGDGPAKTQINIINFTPRPGDDPEQAKINADEARKQITINENEEDLIDV